MTTRLLAIGLLAGVGAHAQEQEFRADLRFVTGDLPSRHPGFFTNISREDFTAAARRLESDIPNLNGAQFYTRLQELVALAGDAHTTLSLNGAAGQYGLQSLGIQFRWFADGVFVTGSSFSNRGLLKAELRKVGGTPIGEVLERLANVVSHENRHWVRKSAPGLLANPGVLRGIGVIAPDAAASYEFLLPNGETQTVEITEPMLALLPAVGILDGYQMPHMVDSEQIYRSQYFPESRMLYIRYSQCAEQPGNPYAAFAQRTIDLLTRNPVETVFYDLRDNAGGNSAISIPLLFGLFQVVGSLRAANPKFQFYIVSNEGTFSSGGDEVSRYRLTEFPPEAAGVTPPGSQPVAAVHLGEPTGGKPGSFGEVRAFNLPGSRIAGQHSTRFFDRDPWLPEADSIYPEVWLPVYARDFFARHDAHIGAALSRAKPAKSPAGSALVYNAAGPMRPELGVAPGSRAFVKGEYPEAAEVWVGDRRAQVLARSAMGIEFLVPAEAAVGAADVEVRHDGGTVAGKFEIAGAGPGLLEAALSGLTLRLKATGAPANVGVWVANRPAEVLGVTPGEDGFSTIEVRLPAGLRGEVPVFAAAGGLMSNGLAVSVP